MARISESTGVQGDLLSDLDSFRLVRISADDAKLRTDQLLDLRNLILSNEEMYPGIGKWFDSKVLSEIKVGRRHGYLGVVNGKPLVSPVAKKGRIGKFCHLRIDDSIQNLGLGDLFFALMALDLRAKSKEIRFTLPEHLWADKSEFFKSFGFDTASKSGRQYRLFEEELFCNSDFRTVFRHVRDKLPKLVGRFSVGDHSLLTQLLVSLRPDNAEKILSGQKSVEIRRRFSKSWENQRATLYATKPIGAIVGEARIRRVIGGKPERIWEHFGHLVGCDKQQFDSYVSGSDEVFALVLDDITAFGDSIPIEQLSYLLDFPLKAPQSYLKLHGNDGWTSAISLAAALQSTIGRSFSAR